MKSIAWIMLLAVPLFGCLADSRASGTVSYSVVLSGGGLENAVFGNRKIEFIFSQFSFDEAVARYRSAPAEQVDFLASQVVLLDAGQVNNGGVSLEMNSVVESGGVLTLTATRRPAGANCLVTQSIAEPFMFVKVDSLLPVETVTVQSKVVDC